MICIIGGGATGLLVAANLQRHAPQLEFTIVEPGSLGGLAYATQDPVHRLNVRAAKMSAWVDRPDDFANWAKVAPDSFAQRRAYGEYLRSLVDSRRVVKSRALSVAVDGKVTLDDGQCIETTSVVLAMGHLASLTAALPAWEALPDEALTASRIVVLGSGLTCVDVLLSLEARGYRGPVDVVSRHGWLPGAHQREVVAARMPNWPATFPSARSVIAAARRHVSEGGSWQSGVDGIRTKVAAIWTSLPTAEKARFVRHAGTVWNTVRHRVPVDVAEQIAGWKRQGRLRIHLGRIDEATSRSVRIRHAGQTTVLDGLVIDALGPSSKQHPLVESLIAEGHARPGPLNLGVLADLHGAIVDASGKPSSKLFTLGPLLRGELWETTAIPEIAAQADALARRLMLRM